MKPRERILATINGQIPDRVPWLEMVIDPTVAEKLLGRPSDFRGRFNIDPGLLDILELDNIAVNLKPPDVTEKHQAAGVEYVGAGLIHGWDDIDYLRSQLPDAEDPEFYRPFEEYLEQYKGDYAAVACFRAGVANAYLSMGIENFCLAIYDDLKLVETIIDIFNEWTLQVVERVNKMGFDLAVISDDLCDQRGPIFSPQILRELFAPRYLKVNAALDIPWILHTDGNFMPILDDLIDLGIVGIANIEPGAVDIVELKQTYGDRITLMGNIDLHYTLTRGTPAEVSESVKKRIEQCAPNGRYIMASENSIPSYVLPENLKAMSQAVEQYGYYK
ncbi:MAG: uroporphyrinogen decarboxylase family protein [Limnochordia bacterium]|jgi:uroporphyrinogen decarboxylase